MNLSYHIQPKNVKTSNADLYMEINAQGLSYIILENGVCMALVIYQFGEGSTDEIAAGYIHQVVAAQPVLRQRFNKVHIIYGYEPSVLVPHQFMNGTDNNDMLELVYGEAGERVTRTDFMYRHAIHIVYGIPVVIEQVITRYFALGEFTHLFSLLPDVVKSPGNNLYCIFSTGKMTALLLKEGKLQVMQQYSFKTPEDVAYNLLNLCNSFNLKVNDLLLSLSGMIDTDSALYRELYKYFVQIQLEALPAQYQYPEGMNQYPPHYFSHLFAIAACV